MKNLSYADARWVFYTLLASRAYRGSHHSLKLGLQMAKQRASLALLARAKRYDRLAGSVPSEAASAEYARVYAFWRDSGFAWPHLRFALYCARQRMETARLETWTPMQQRIHAILSRVR